MMTGDCLSNCIICPPLLYAAIIDQRSALISLMHGNVLKHIAPLNKPIRPYVGCESDGRIFCLLSLVENVLFIPFF
jgi:hypothetical protein